MVERRMFTLDNPKAVRIIRKVQKEMNVKSGDVDPIWAIRLETGIKQFGITPSMLKTSFRLYYSKRNKLKKVL